jgi:predicted ATP-grasp superfamily ATP-dependent carboligase
MLRAVLDDFQTVTRVEVCTLLAPDLATPLPGRCHFSGAGEQATFLRLAKEADATLVIAPESDDILAERCRWIDKAGARSLGCPLPVVQLTGDKLALASYWQQHRVATPATKNWDRLKLGGDARADCWPLVCKPRHGAGSQATSLIHDARELARCRNSAHVEVSAADMIVQPYCPGLPASVAFLIGPRQCVPLLPAKQHLSDDGRFRYLGGSLPLPEPLGRRAVALAQRAVRCVPGLRGYVGVDLVLGSAEDGSDDVVIEINPRLTTSYIGLRQLALGNLAEAWLAVLEERPVALRWREGVVQFDAAGEVRRA